MVIHVGTCIHRLEMATMAPVPYPNSRPASFSLLSRLETRGEWAGFGQPEGLRRLFGVNICDMGWNEALTYVETISNLRLNARALSFVDGRTALRLSTSAESRAVLGNRILLPASRTLAFAARLKADGPLKTSFEAGAFVDALLTYVPQCRVALVGVNAARLDATRERLSAHAPWHAFSVLSAVNLGSGIAGAPDLVIADALGYDEELRFEQALSLRHNGLIIMAGGAFDRRNS